MAAETLEDRHADTAEGAKWTKAPRLVETLHYRQDRRGFLGNRLLHLFVVPADGGTPRQLTAGPGTSARAPTASWTIPLSWTPDGRAIVFDGLRAEDADTRWRESHLYAIDVGPKDPPDHAAHGPVAAPADLAEWPAHCLRRLRLDATDLQSGRAAVVDFDGSNARRIATDLDRDPERPAMGGGRGKGLYFTANDQGARNVWYAPAGGGKARQVTEGDHILSLTDRSEWHRRGGALDAAASGGRGGVPSSRAGPPCGLTNLNDDVLAGVKRRGERSSGTSPRTAPASRVGW